MQFRVTKFASRVYPAARPKMAQSDGAIESARGADAAPKPVVARVFPRPNMPATLGEGEAAGCRLLFYGHLPTGPPAAECYRKTAGNGGLGHHLRSERV
jgi:hypothetical protein